MNQGNNRAIIIFVRTPELGKVKTRIAATVGAKRALEIYQSLLTHTQLVCEEIDSERYVFYAGEIDYEDQWSKNSFEKFLQKNGDLGDRMEDAFETVLRKTTPALIIGSDCAELTSEDIERAFIELEDNDVVIGPAEDGGYYLLGMNDLQLFLFRDMPWSEETLLQETIFKIQDRGLRYSLLNTKSDVDFIEDWERSKHLVKST